jgi:hypothetical protein
VDGIASWAAAAAREPAQIDYHFQQSIKMDMMAVAYRTDNLLD